MLLLSFTVDQIIASADYAAEAVIYVARCGCNLLFSEIFTHLQINKIE